MNRIFFGDCRESIKDLILVGQQVQMCVTSPPYYGLRDYGNENQLGLENSPEQYIKNLVEVFSLVRDILKDDGTLWLNLGDSYTGSGKGGNPEDSPFKKQKTNAGSLSVKDNIVRGKRITRGHGRWGGGDMKVQGLPPRNLIGIPWRVALALQADGWYLRQDIIWHKPNPMPESVRSRCTKAHEYIFLLSKSPKYYFDSDAISEPVTATTTFRLAQNIESQAGSLRVPNKTNGPMKAVGGGMRNKRSVWTVTTKPYKGAHFATFPPDLIAPCIKAGSKKGDTVFDPFIGSGTSAQVALSLSRRYIGCELNQDYEPLIQKRISSIK
jgi:DNA modification methylase